MTGFITREGKEGKKRRYVNKGRKAIQEEKEKKVKDIGEGKVIREEGRKEGIDRRMRKCVLFVLRTARRA